MVLKYCFSCKFHQVKPEAEEYSYCARENCYSVFSKCISRQALSCFLEQEVVKDPRETAKSEGSDKGQGANTVGQGF